MEADELLDTDVDSYYTTLISLSDWNTFDLILSDWIVVHELWDIHTFFGVTDPNIGYYTEISTCPMIILDLSEIIG